MRKQDGFTIIEVALVLAIAGLIFVMVFIALPALWASERDSERRDDMLSFVQQLKNFQTNNNRGALPTLTLSEQNNLTAGRWLTIEGDTITPSANVTGTSWVDFYTSYFNETFADPNGPRYNFIITNCGTDTLDAECTADALDDLMDKPFPNNYNMYIVLGATCYGEGAISSANSRKVAVLYKLESSGIYCANT